MMLGYNVLQYSDVSGRPETACLGKVFVVSLTFIFRIHSSCIIHTVVHISLLNLEANMWTINWN